MSDFTGLGYTVRFQPFPPSPLCSSSRSAVRELLPLDRVYHGVVQVQHRHPIASVVLAKTKRGGEERETAPGALRRAFGRLWVQGGDSAGQSNIFSVEPKMYVADEDDKRCARPRCLSVCASRPSPSSQGLAVAPWRSGTPLASQRVYGECGAAGHPLTSASPRALTMSGARDHASAAAVGPVRWWV